MTRQWLENSIDLRKLFAAIDADPAIVGAGVVYLDAQLRIVVLREFQPICSIAPKNVILREAPSYVGRVEFARQLANEPRDSQVAFEAVNMGLACTSAVISWLVILGGLGVESFYLWGDWCGCCDRLYVSDGQFGSMLDWRSAD
jgi:hypothetical protein